MNMGKKITELREGTKIPRESRYVLEMGDGTGTKQVKHHNLVAQLLEDMSLGYDETMEFLNGTGIAEGNEALRAFRDWLVSRVVNNLMTTEAGFFLDGRVGKTLADGLDEINSNLNRKFILQLFSMEYELIADRISIIDVPITAREGYTPYCINFCAFTGSAISTCLSTSTEAARGVVWSTVTGTYPIRAQIMYVRQNN